ncbi:hypothetical protein [Streptomyces sp. NPDC091215]|uniref:hypothetical protein n=1 Tax=Streptomyces sp. NPDC091215 TaxID=3155192 RepID=UPI003419BE88
MFAAALLWNTKPGLQAFPAMGHVQGVDDEFGVVVVGLGVAEDLAGGQIQPAGEVEPALGGG